MKLKPTHILHVAFDFGGEEVKMGRMAQKDGKIWFEYDVEFIAQKMEVSPFRLPLKEGVSAAKYQPFEGLYGIFNDSLPDGWGRLLLDRALTARGIPFQSLTALDRLAYVGKSGMGALVYYPETDLGKQSEEFLDLNALADEVEEVLQGEASELLDQLCFLGGSSAGARPKIVAGYNAADNQLIHGQKRLPDGFSHWLIKFPSSSDHHDIAKTEFAYSEMAKAAGIAMTATKLFQGNRKRMYFGTERFDRSGTQRLHMHTATGLLNADHRSPSLDYEILLKCTLALTNDMREAEKMYRLAAFNVFAHNRDDHGKNFSFLMDANGNWRLAPAYDLTFSYGPRGQQSTTVLNEGRAPGKSHLLGLGEKFAIRGRKEILDEVQSAVSNWNEFAKAADVSEASRKMIAKAIL